MIYFIVCGTWCAAIGYFFGRYQERYAWNKLIQKGILPTPKKK